MDPSLLCVVQAEGPMRHSFWIGVAILTVGSHAHAQTNAALPANIEAPGWLEGKVTEVYAQSDTFRAQCDRLAQATNLHIRVSLDTTIPHFCRAFTVISRKRGVVCAEVHMPASS